MSGRIRSLRVPLIAAGLVAAAAVVATCAVAAGAASHPAHPGAPRHHGFPRPGSISGQVVSGGQPLGHVVVTAAPAGFGHPGFAVTNAEGQYKIRGLRPSIRYAVCFNPAHATGGSSTTGYLPTCFHRAASASGSTGAAKAAGAKHARRGVTLVRVRPGQDRKGIDATISPAAEISGTVTDAGTGAAVQHVKVLVIPRRSSASGGSGSGSSAIALATAKTVRPAHAGRNASRDVTAADGSYAIKGLPADPNGYTVCFNAGFAKGSPTGYLNQCYNDVPWTHWPIPSAASAVQVTLGQNTSGVDAALQRGAAIAGRITDSANQHGIPHATVFVVRSGRTVAVGFSTRHGHYRVSRLAATTYKVCVVAGPWFKAECYKDTPWVRGAMHNATALTTQGGATTTGIDVALAPRHVKRPVAHRK